MSAIPTWHTEKDHDYTHQVRWIQCTALPAIFLTSISLIAIGCSALCLTLSGINALTDVVLPFMLPGGVGLALSIPLIVLSVVHTQKRKKVRKEWVEQIHEHLKTIDSPSADNIRESILLTGWRMEFKKALLKELMDKYPDEDKKNDEDQDPLYTALSKAYQNVGAPQKKQ